MNLIQLNNSFDSITRNGTYMDKDENEDNDYLYDRSDVRAVCIILYSIVFIACFFGNLIVMVVVSVHWRMRSITNFCLANLAFADFCVSIFCVYQNMYIYFTSSWIFGAFLCKMYYFITELSHTASILILVVICIERYLAIVHPMNCKNWLTITRLRCTIIGVWSTSAIYSSPRLYFTNIRTMYLNNNRDDGKEIICIPIRTLYHSETFDMISLVFLFILPLFIITILYTKIALVLWESSKCHMGQQSYLTTQPSISNITPSSASISQPEIYSSSSSEHDDDDDDDDCDGTNKKSSITKHSCIDILCCGCDPCRIRILLRTSGKINHPHLKKKYSHGSLSSSSSSSSSSEQKRLSSNDNHKNIINTTKEPTVVFTFEKKYNSLLKQKNQKLNNHHHHHHQRPIMFNDTESKKNITSSSTSSDFTCKTLNLPKIKITNKNTNTLELECKTNKIKQMTILQGGKYGSRVLDSRRKIIKMLIVIVFTFTLFNLPFHARKIWQYYGKSYYGGSTFSSIFTPLTFLIMYANSGINPILYAFMSRKFRLCFMDLMNCKLKKSKLYVERNVSVRSTHITTPHMSTTTA